MCVLFSLSARFDQSKAKLAEVVILSVFCITLRYTNICKLNNVVSPNGND